MKKFLCTVFICILLFPIFTVYGDEAENIKIEAEVGFDKSYKPYFTTPVFITMENNYKDIEGEIQIEIPYDESYGNAVTMYAIGINHPKNTEKKYVINLPIPSSLLNVKLKVVEGKKVLMEKYIRLDRGISDNTMLVGLLSDDIDSLNYLTGFTYDNISSTISTKLVRLNEESFPGSIDVMNNFDMIIINNYDTSKLTEEQYSVLKKWTELGGYLVIGTGATGSKTLSVFRDDFITGERGDIVRASGKALGSFVNDEFNMPLDIMDIKIKEGVSLVESEGFPLIQKLDKAQGGIIILSFDIGLEPIVSWKLNKYFMESVFQSTAPTVLRGPQFERYYNRGFDYQIESALKNIPELPLPQYGAIIIIFIIYIILVAPVSYFVLKKMDKRELMWGVVPVFSIIFAAVVYFAGFGTRITEPLLNTVSVIRINDKGIYDIKSFGGIFTPNKTNLKIQGIEDIKIKPFMRNNYYGRSDNQTWDDKRVDAKFILSPKPSLEFYDIGVWGMKTFEIETNKSIEGNIVGNVSYVGSDYVGFIENNSALDLEDCLIVTANQYIKLGNIKKGEKLEIPKGESKSFANKYELMDNLYNRLYQRDKSLKDEEIEKQRSNNQKRNIVEYYFNYEQKSMQGIKFIAWSKTPVIGDILVNNKTLKRYDSTMVTADLKLNVKSGNTVELPFGYIEPTIIQDSFMKGHYDLYENRFYGNGTVEIDYSIGNGIRPENVKIRFDTPSSNTKQFIWNQESKNWEERGLSNYTIEGQDLEKYLDENNTLKLKFDINEDGMQLPQISVKGSVK